MAKQAKAKAAIDALRKHGLTYPGAHTKSPWPGHLDLAVRDKTFAFLSDGGSELHATMKLPRSSDVALLLPFAEPAGYGLGKTGWVAATFKPNDDAPLDVLMAWLDESYRAQAPKKLVSELDQRADAKVSTKPKLAPKAKTSAKKPARATKPRKKRA